MSPERWQQIEEVFEAAIDLTPKEREDFLSLKCDGDDELRAEVLKLISNDESARDFIESPVWTDSSFLNSTAKRIISDSLDRQIGSEDNGDYIGKQIGAYRIVSEIGRGGMGAVYRAERADGEFSQKVAIKLIKRGMDSDFIIRRFRHERQILASFEHPFIARLLDGGTTKDGIPYFVMEFIEGETLYNYCDKNVLDLRARLKMFQKICSALQYAHERQIVHRDIKPSNILINKFGSPKLLDFGIAKILDPNLIHESVNPTASLMRMMTPDYASPEQVQGAEVTPASDIYSLGILLYELLSGHKPYNFSGRALHEVSRVICEVMPELPSIAVNRSDNLLPQYSSSKDRFADVRSASSAALKQQLETNLDNIVMKALRKEPAMRYKSVKELSEDISRHLNGQLVSAPAFITTASPNSSVHLSASNSRALAVLPFKYLSLSPQHSADDQFLGLGLADALITRLSKVKRFVVRPTSSIISFGAEPVDPVTAGRELRVEYIIDGNIKRAGDRIRVSVQLLKVADNAAIWAASIDETLNDVFSLEDTISTKLIEVLLPQLTGSELAEYSKRGTEVPEAFEHYLRARFYFNTFTEDGLAKAFVSFHRAIAADPNYAHAYAGIADYYNWLGIIGVLPPQECFQPAIEAATTAVELDEELSEAHASLGFSLHAGNYDWAQAEHHLRRAIELNPGNASAYVWYSIVLYTEGRFTDGLEFARRSLDLDPLTPFNHHNIGWGYYYARRYEEGIAQYKKVIADFPDYVFGYYGLSKIHRITGETEIATRENARAMELMDNGVFTLIAEAECLAADGRHDEAREKLAVLKGLSNERYVSPYQLSLAYCYLGDKEAAIEHLIRAYEIKEAWLNWMGIEPVLDLIRDDERFGEIWKNVGYYGLFTHSGITSTPSVNSGPETQAIRQTGLHDLTTLVIAHNEDTGEAMPTGEITGPVRKRNNYLNYAVIILLLLVGTAAVMIGVPYFREPAPVPAATTNFQNPSIAVLPFKSTDGTRTDFGIGLADALTNKLGNIKSLQVMSASSGRAIADMPVEQIGKDLGMAFVLRGDLVTEANGIKLNAELVRTSDNSVLWAEELTAGEGDMFRMQTNLAEHVWTSLGIEPLPLERQQVYRSYTQNDTAYRYYLIGRYQTANRTPESLRKAIETFSASIAADPGFALAYVGLADCYALLNLYDIKPPRNAYPLAQENALKALAIDNNLAEAHATLAYVKYFYERDWSGAELEFRRALQVNPSYAQARHWFALAFAGMGRPVEAVSEAEIGERLDPRSPSVRSAKGMVHFFNREYNAAIEDCDRALQLNESFLPALKVKRWVYTVTGNFAAARANFDKEMLYSGGNSSMPGWQIIELQLTPPDQDASAKLKVLENAILSPDIADIHFAFAYVIALAFNALGRHDKAIDWLERADAARSHGFNFLVVDPRFANLRGDLRFRHLVREIDPTFQF